MLSFVYVIHKRMSCKQMMRHKIAFVCLWLVVFGVLCLVAFLSCLVLSCLPLYALFVIPTMLGIMNDILPFMPSIIIMGFIAGLGGGFSF